MLMKKLTLPLGLLLPLLLVAGCSDSGDDNPTGSGGSGGNTPALSVADAVADEGATMSFTVTASAAPTSDVTFTALITALSAGASDYTLGSASGTLSVGNSSTTVDVTIANDAVAEASEVFRLVISAPTNATIADGEALGRITPSDGGADISFSGAVQSLVSTWCGACHISTTNGGLNMGAGPTAAGLRAAAGSNGAIIAIGQAASSNLYRKTTDTPPFGARMPFGGPYLSTAQQNQIRDWINQGAQDN